MMYSYAVVLASPRHNMFRLHRPFFSCSLCSMQRNPTISRPKLLCYSNGAFIKNDRLYRNYTSVGQLQQTPTPPLPPPQPSPPDENDSSLSIFQRFKIMFKKYWYVALPVHLVTSSVWFGSFYFLASSGVDVPALLESLGFADWIIDKVRNGNSWKSYMLIAYGLYKIFTPLRYMVTLGGTGITIRYLRTLGYSINQKSLKK